MNRCQSYKYIYINLKMEMIPDVESKYVVTKKTMVDGGWLCANVPCKVISNDGSNVILLPFNKSQNIHITDEIYKLNYYQLESDETYVYISGYPHGKIAISEFTTQSISIKKLKKHFKEDINFSKLIAKVVQDSFHSKGNNSCITIEKYNEFATESTHSKLERIGDPIFNRSVRHSPPISKTFTRENFEQSSSYPAPIGIREEDFALPSEQNEILIELLNQIFSCENAPICPEEIVTELNLSINPNSHTCLWCGEILNILKLNQEYCSIEHTINFCHRIPEVGTKRGNVYIGHCSCNREQGGYSEEERVIQVIRLAKCNPHFKEKILQELDI